MQLLEDLQLNKKTWNYTGNKKKGQISRGDQEAY